MSISKARRGAYAMDYKRSTRTLRYTIARARGCVYTMGRCKSVRMLFVQFRANRRRSGIGLSSKVAWAAPSRVKQRQRRFSHSFRSVSGSFALCYFVGCLVPLKSPRFPVCIELDADYGVCLRFALISWTRVRSTFKNMQTVNCFI